MLAKLKKFPTMINKPIVDLLDHYENSEVPMPHLYAHLNTSRTLLYISCRNAFLCVGLISLVVSLTVNRHLNGAEEAIPPNYDESKVPCYDLPDPLVMSDGSLVETPETWTQRRRPEILGLFEEHVYGKSILKPLESDFLKTQMRIIESGEVFGGKGKRYQIRLVFYIGTEPKPDDPAFDMLIYSPSKEGRSEKCPAFIGLNFQGNHTISKDVEIPLREIWSRRHNKMGQAQEADRGRMAWRYPVETLIERGYAFGTAFYCDIEPDTENGRQYGVRRLIYKDNENPAPQDANTIATWAWGLSKMLDAVVQFQDELGIDSNKVAVFGHSRLGKTALWAGAIDPRFALVVSNNSGCGGAALSRREFGETVRKINKSFPHWFCGHFKKYGNNVNAMPVDQHELIALMAPRPVYVASASNDLWADPKGEFLSCLLADSVYRLLGTDGFGGVKEMPELNTSVGGRIGYHNRKGGHSLTEFDWIQFMNFADTYL